MIATAAPIFLPQDLESTAWLKLKAHLESELVDRRAYNDGRSLDAVETAFVRGDIDRLKRILKIGSKAPG